MGTRKTISELKIKGMYRCRCLRESIHSDDGIGVWDKPENIAYGLVDFLIRGNRGSIKVNEVFMVIEEARPHVVEFVGTTTYAKVLGADFVGYIAALQLDTIFEEITEEEQVTENVAQQQEE